MNWILNDITFFLSGIPFARLGRAILVLLIGILLIRIITKILSKMLRQKQFNTKTSSFTEKITGYLLYTVLISLVLHELGVSPSVLIGTAGFLTVALGFASQTSVSNIISGLFLVGEKTFAVGDVIQVEDITGYVLSIDLLSVKVRTYENLLVRLPNEMLIKAKVVNETHFPIRRLDLILKLGIETDIERLREILTEVARLNILCLEEPKPLFLVMGMGEGLVEIKFGVWAKKENFFELKNAIQIEIKKAFDRYGITLPPARREFSQIK